LARSIIDVKEKMGWMKGIEPSTSGTTNQRSNRLSYTHHEANCTLFLLGYFGKPTSPVFFILGRMRLGYANIPNQESQILVATRVI
jgi:hypothetical protein